MGRIKVLDCTLRDGGYVNQWEFGRNNIKKIIELLTNAQIDVIECGFLKDETHCNKNRSIYNLPEDLDEDLYLSEKSEYVCMINYGEYDVNKLPQCDGKGVTGIRLAFHKNNMLEAINECHVIKEKGYNVYIQPMVTMSYSDDEFLNLIKESNQVNPKAFYIVDSFGVMKKNDLLRLFYLVDHNLNKEILVGFHSHNNLQLSYSNAQALCSVETSREIIIDASVLGMGRGAGNLNTELFIDYLNNILQEDLYEVTPVLQIIDQVLNPIYLTNYWGYSLAYYLSAIYNCHPNYGMFLNEKNTLTVEDMNKILAQISDDKKNIYDKKYINLLYNQYQCNNRNVQNKCVNLFGYELEKVLLIAPGKSLISQSQQILEFQTKGVTAIAINFAPDLYHYDYIFVSNIKRYQNLKISDAEKTIVTSNIKCNNYFQMIDYQSLLNNNEYVSDNAGLMAIKLCIENGVKEIYLAGFDGYTDNMEANYVDRELTLFTKKNILHEMNNGIISVLGDFSRKTKISFITESLYQKGL